MYQTALSHDLLNDYYWNTGRFRLNFQNRQNIDYSGCEWLLDNPIFTIVSYASRVEVFFEIHRFLSKIAWCSADNASMPLRTTIVAEIMSRTKFIGNFFLKTPVNLAISNNETAASGWYLSPEVSFQIIGELQLTWCHFFIFIK